MLQMFAQLFSIVVFLFAKHGSFQEFDLPKSCDMNTYLNYNWCSALDSETVIVMAGGEYTDAECSVYVLPSKSLTAIQCPLNISQMSANDSNCYRVFYNNGSIRNINIELSLSPTYIDVGRKVSREPFNGESITLICPLFGVPELNYTWSIPINGQQYSGMNLEKLHHLKVTEDKENNGTILSKLHYFVFKLHCPTGLFIVYYDYAEMDGDYFCTGSNEFGEKTMLAANVKNGGVCLSPFNEAFYSEGEVIVELQREYKVSPGDIGGDVNLTCKVLPFTNHLKVVWALASKVASITSLCEDNGDQYSLNANSKYTVSAHRDKCTKVSSLIIHDFAESDKSRYACVAQLCQESGTKNIFTKSVEVGSDTDTLVKTDWVFSFTALPILIALATAIILSIVIYVNKVRLIRWYFSWRREEPSGNFAYDVFICIPEEYDGELIGQVRDEILYQIGDVRVLWQESENCNLVGLNHYVHALEIMNKCRKFVFIVNERFGHCFFCKQMVELVTEKSKVKNLNIILPVKWTDRTIVPRELLVYRYVEREGNMGYLGEIDNFLKGKSVVNRNRRSTTNFYQILFSKSYDRTSLLITNPLINP